MDFNLIQKIVKLFEKSEIAAMELQEDNFKIKLSKTGKTPVISMPSAPALYPHAPEIIQPALLKPSQDTPDEVVKEEKITGLHEIRSPIVGTFYRAPAPDADPYVKVGDVVGSGTVLCLIEAMKLMNEIESDVSGKVVKILVDNAKPVEYNQPLFLIEKS
ncbi:MAG: acetyl-CoA carboxylase biotin carboxyl carrier protein [Ignavibacteriaceae bacterium]|nr:acetyl-CoA carboxylase biotin carboxyl carrier protein [Ignavibacteriaceae bacterium]